MDHRSRAFVFDDIEDHQARIAEPDLDIDETCVMVLHKARRRRGEGFALSIGVYPDLKGRHVFITGGASGIGGALVRAFVAQGANVGFIDIRQDDGRALAALTGASFFPGDLKDIDALKAAIHESETRYGPIRALVNNAADDTRHDLREVTPAYWDDRLAVNLRPSFFAAQAAAPLMASAGGGAIINFGSISWRIAAGGLVAYATAKAAMLGLTRSLARDLGAQRIRVNTITPGWVMTEKQLALWVDDKARDLIRASQCLPGSVMPDDVAELALFLASDAAKMISAQDFVVDGGWI